MKCGAMDRVQHMASYWSALVHDYEHGGLNNDFLIKTYHPLAITYNDQSPLENHHAAAAARLFACPELQYHPVSLASIPAPVSRTVYSDSQLYSLHSFLVRLFKSLPSVMTNS